MKCSYYWNPFDLPHFTVNPVFDFEDEDAYDVDQKDCVCLTIVMNLSQRLEITKTREKEKQISHSEGKKAVTSAK